MFDAKTWISGRKNEITSSAFLAEQEVNVINIGTINRLRTDRTLAIIYIYISGLRASQLRMFEIIYNLNPWVQFETKSIGRESPYHPNPTATIPS